MNLIETDKKYIANTYARYPLAVKEGSGDILTDGKDSFIDLGSGIAVNTFGMCDESWVNAVTNQLHKYAHISNYYYSEPSAELAKMLCERTGMCKVFFSNSGAEANECAIKAARKYACDKLGSDYYTIVTLENSFHGRTLTTLAATGQDTFHKDFLPLTNGFVHAKVNDIDDLTKKVEENKCAAIMIEFVQGEGGVNVLDKEFVEAVFTLAEKHNIIVIADEVQTGNGRTGKLYAHMHYGVKPDIFTTAKGLCGGLPLGATVLGEKVKDIFTPGLNGSTFGGNPVCCAGALNVLSRLTEDFLNEVTKKAEFIHNELSGSKGIKSVSGLGLMIGIETVKDAKEIAKACFDRKVLVLTAKDRLRLLPPLNIEYSHLKDALNIIKEECAI